MARDFQIAGQSLVYVRALGGSLSELGLTAGPITVGLTMRQEDIQVDAWGGRVPPEIQSMLAEASIQMNLIHFDNDYLRQLMGRSFGSAGTSAATYGLMPAAGFRLSSLWVTLYIYSPAGGITWWRFPAVHMTSNMSWPLGTEKSVARVTFRAVPVPGGNLSATSFDPWQSSNGSLNAVLWDHTAGA